MRLHHFASDDHLVDRVRAGSAVAFEALFDRHHRPLLAFCRHMLGSTADAEDAVQHTFMAAYADLTRSDKRITLRPWLYSIARHRCVSMLRARRERPVADLPEPEVHHLAAEIEVREELRATLSDIARLPEDQRAALILAELGDASHSEIAEILGCRQDKVKALVFQARSSLASDRVARETPCDEVREQLALGGLAIRRSSLRRHVRACTGCREFDELVRLQRRRLRILLPVAPSLGFKRAVLGTLAASGGGATSGVTALVGGLAATAVVTVTVATGGGSPASASPAGRDTVMAAITGPAWIFDAPGRATALTGPGGAPESGAYRSRPEPLAGDRGAESPGSPAETTPSATGGERHAAPVVPTKQAVHQAAAGRDLGDAQPEGAPDPPNGNKPSAPPGGGPPDSPSGGRPDSPQRGGKPASPPGGRPESPPGGRPESPPAGRPESPPAGGSPGSPPDAGKPDGPPPGAPVEPAAIAVPQSGKPDEPPADPRHEAPANGPDQGPQSGANESGPGRPPR